MCRVIDRLLCGRCRELTRAPKKKNRTFSSVDREVVERLWDYAFKERLRVDPIEHPILHTGPHCAAR